MNGICLIYGVESRVLSVTGCPPRYSGSQLFGVLRDGAELGETYRHYQQVLQGMFKVMVQQQGFMAVTK